MLRSSLVFAPCYAFLVWGCGIPSESSQIDSLVSDKSGTFIGQLDPDLRPVSAERAKAFSAQGRRMTVDPSSGDELCFVYLDHAPGEAADRWIDARKRAFVKVDAHDDLSGKTRFEKSTATDVTHVDLLDSQDKSSVMHYEDFKDETTTTTWLRFRMCTKRPDLAPGTRWVTLRMQFTRGSKHPDVFVWHVAQGGRAPAVDPVATRTADLADPAGGGGAVVANPAGSGTGGGTAIVATLQSAGGFEQFVRALDESGVGSSLADAGSYTVFAPRDSAFANLSPAKREGLFGDKAHLAEVVRNHVVDGRLSSDALGKLVKSKLRALGGKKLAVKDDHGTLRVGIARVERPDLPASNSTIFVVDTLLDN